MKKPDALKMELAKIFLTWLLACISKRYAAQKRSERLIRDKHRQYQIMNDLGRKTHALRVIILRTENNGGTLRTDTPLFVRALDEVNLDDEAPNRFDTWGVPRQIDASYVDMLWQVCESPDFAIVKTNKLKKGVLRSVYEADKVAFSAIGKLKHTAHHIYYLSINYADGNTLADGDRMMILDSIALLKDLLK